MRNTLLLVAVLVAVLLAIGLLAFSTWRGSPADPDVRSTSPAAAETPGTRRDAASGADVVAPESIASATAQDRTLATEPTEPAAAPALPKTDTTIVGRCVDFDGRPLARVRIGIRSPRGVDAETDEDGRFHIVCAADATELASVSLRASGRCVVKSERDVPLVPHTENDAGEWRLERGGSIAGKVIDSDGRPVDGARVLTTRGYDVVLDDARRQDVWSDEADTHTGASGAFELEGVKPGRVRVWATQRRFYNAVSDAFDLRADEERRDVELVLEPEAPEDGVDLQVLLPDGSPCADARVMCEYAATNVSGSTSVPCDAQGRGHFRLIVGARHDFRASDRAGLHGEAVVTGVERGHPPIVLRLGTAESTVLVVVDEADQQVATARALLRRHHEGGSNAHSIARGSGGAKGRFNFVAPSGRWSVEASAEGFEALELGPFESDAAPKELRATLKRLPGLVGRVLADGKPVANASVSEGHQVSRTTKLLVNDFPAEREFQRGSSATSDADGRFVLYPEHSGELLVRAEAPGFAPTVVGPILYDATRGKDGVDVELLLGGTLEGRVLLPAGESAAGTIVGASCGDGFAQTTRTGSDGVYRFERLTPGRWLVKRCEKEISPHSTTSSSMSGDEEVAALPWNVLVQDGETVRFDLDLRSDPRPHARGRLSVGGRPLAGWNVLAHTSGDTWGESGDAITDELGEFDVHSPSPGAGFLSLESRIDAQCHRAFYIPTEWGPRELVVERDFPGGRVALSRAPSQDTSGWFELATKDAVTGGQWELRVELAPGASRVLEDVPAGEWTVMPIGVEGASVYDPLQVRAGETATYVVP
ncbi:MAG: carboxypeptidase-like regulatory domain-containing protein [Planctomycetes bacterium]|nr:carboxypeptidase-like regulatory domain-containing protein [Planctomycetota bacterium]